MCFNVEVGGVAVQLVSFWWAWQIVKVRFAILHVRLYVPVTCKALG